MTHFEKKKEIKAEILSSSQPAYFLDNFTACNQEIYYWPIKNSFFSENIHSVVN